MSVIATGTSAAIVGDVRQPAPPGVITHASATVQNADFNYGDLYVSIDVVPVGQPVDTPIYHLVEGIVSPLHGIAWNGLLSLDSNAEVVMTYRGLWFGQLSLNYKRLTLTSIQEIGRYVRSLGV
jgi:hypothetical protein